MSDQPSPVLAACLIVKNAAETIEQCVSSIRPFVDEINIYDTGSTDDTLDVLDRLARQRRAPVGGNAVPLATIRVERGEWRNDFAWARERSFEMASPETEWLVWVDADDEVKGGETLRDVTASAPAELDGFMCAYDLPLQEGGIRSRAWRERLVRADRGFRWSGRVHETLGLPDRQPHMHPVDPERLRWIHIQPPDRGNLGRNIELLLGERERAEEAGEAVDSVTLLYLGTEHVLAGDLGAAVGYLTEYLDRPATRGATIGSTSRLTSPVASAFSASPRVHSSSSSAHGPRARAGRRRLWALHRAMPPFGAGTTSFFGQVARSTRKCLVR